MDSEERHRHEAEFFDKWIDERIDPSAFTFYGADKDFREVIAIGTCDHSQSRPMAMALIRMVPVLLMVRPPYYCRHLRPRM